MDEWEMLDRMESYDIVAIEVWEAICVERADM